MVEIQFEWIYNLTPNQQKISYFNHNIIYCLFNDNRFFIVLFDICKILLFFNII